MDKTYLTVEFVAHRMEMQWKLLGICINPNAEQVPDNSLETPGDIASNATNETFTVHSDKRKIEESVAS